MKVKIKKNVAAKIHRSKMSKPKNTHDSWQRMQDLKTLQRSSAQWLHLHFMFIVKPTSLSFLIARMCAISMSIVQVNRKREVQVLKGMNCQCDAHLLMGLPSPWEQLRAINQLLLHCSFITAVTTALWAYPIPNASLAHGISAIVR